MASANQESNLITSGNLPLKRKRGRPRKNESSGLECLARVQSPHPVDSLARPSGGSIVGQPVSGCLDGVFDSGYFLTVRVGQSGPILKGLVFDPARTVPVTPANDIAPHLPMLRRIEIHLQMTGTLNQYSASPPVCTPPNSGRSLQPPQSIGTGNSSMTTPVIHVFEHMPTKTLATPVCTEKGTPNDANLISENLDYTSHSDLKPEASEPTVKESMDKAEPITPPSLQTSQSAKSNAPTEIILNSETKVGEAVQALSDVGLILSVEVTTGNTLDSGSSDKGLPGNSTVGEALPESAGARIPLTDGKSEEQFEGSEQSMDVALATSEAVASWTDSRMQVCDGSPVDGNQLLLSSG